MSAPKIHVFVVEDSPVARELLIHILESDPDMEVIGSACNGEDALRKISHRRPDVITMDIHMPGIDGFETARRIMETAPTPIVIVTASANHADVDMTFRTLEAGALAIVEKPTGFGGAEHEEGARKLLQTVRLMSEVKVVKRWARAIPETAKPIQKRAKPIQDVQAAGEIKVVAIGASTGGPVAIHTILDRLPKDFEVPILIVQHIAAGFVRGMADWLARDSAFVIHIASQSERLLPGHVYIAPDGYQMGTEREGFIVLNPDDRNGGPCPSVSHLFRTVANVYGQEAVGVLLTGMGRDGAPELRLMKEKGAVTIAQDKESSVIFGMPGEAVRLEAATHVLSPAGIAETLARIVEKNK